MQTRVRTFHHVAVFPWARGHGPWFVDTNSKLPILPILARQRLVQLNSLSLAPYPVISLVRQKIKNYLDHLHLKLKYIKYKSQNFMIVRG